MTTKEKYSSDSVVMTNVDGGHHAIHLCENHDPYFNSFKDIEF